MTRTRSTRRGGVARPPLLRHRARSADRRGSGRHRGPPRTGAGRGRRLRRCGCQGHRRDLGGFAETDARGRELQTELVERVRSYGMRMVGPNCMGVINAAADLG